MRDDREWFAHKRYGYGAGLPTAWQGWAVTIAFVVLVALAGFVTGYSGFAFWSIVALLTTVFILICARTTKGGWRWRWGEED